MSSPAQEQTGLVVRDRDTEVAQFMPALTVEQALARHRQINQIVSQVLKENEDYGVIPGAGAKKVLLKPGAEKLTTFFGLSKQFEIIEKIEDWTGAHSGAEPPEPFFYYRCRLLRGEQLIAEGDGSCNSRESKYRYRKGERVCPSCRGAYIIKGQDQYGGGWVCFKKKGGCGAKFPDGDPDIETQQVGRVLNPDICDQVNTIQKMAVKRALVAATLMAVNASDFFTQDVEDSGVIDARPLSVTPAPQRPTAAAPARGPANPTAPARKSASKVREIIGAAENLRDKCLALGVPEAVLNEKLAEYGVELVPQLTDEDAKKYVAWLSTTFNDEQRRQRDEEEDDFS
jgi:hypothetical protein